eukprot:TRINITY_DN5240_c0_g1_i2.p1 TRINITY_DN5240_c0_g1~~TRINITY_DN5240_c0_g1_i2.p1  ORF type:complete len:643 (+),score=112.90 TRINITY_DN5240_c0_g1_i2:91-2019(+)
MQGKRYDPTKTGGGNEVDKNALLEKLRMKAKAKEKKRRKKEKRKRKREEMETVQNSESAPIPSPTKVIKQKKKKRKKMPKNEPVATENQSATKSSLPTQKKESPKSSKTKKHKQTRADPPKLQMTWKKRKGLEILIPKDLFVPLTERLPKSPPISAHLLHNLQTQFGISKFFPVQAAVLPHLLSSLNLRSVSKLHTQSHGASSILPALSPQFNLPIDVCVCAPTGSGKTLVYAIPIVEALLRKVVTRMRALILVPSRDLAVQALEVFQKLLVGHENRVRMFCFYGGTTLAADKKKVSKYTADIVIATPGRLIELISLFPNHATFNFSHLRFLVLDEADKLLMQFYQDWLRKLMDGISDNMEKNGVVTRKWLFSATLTYNPQKMAHLNFNHANFYVSSTSNLYFVPEKLQEIFIVCGKKVKPLVLYYLLHKKLHNSKVICFGKSRNVVSKIHALLRSMLEQQLKNAVYLESFTADLAQSKRQQIIDSFTQVSGKDQEWSCLVASDAAGRGLDFDDVDCVINYDVPIHTKTYIHRIGRTARAGRKGVAYTIVTKEEVKHFKEVLNKAGAGQTGRCVKKINFKTDLLAEYQRMYSSALSALQKTDEKPTSHPNSRTQKAGETKSLNDLSRDELTAFLRKNSEWPK